MNLTDTQRRIIDTPGNLVVMASAGTGKTFTMVKKIEKEINENSDYKVIAAITFTIKAANEIKERINTDVRDHFIGTNNSFVINEIIKPFLKDVCGDDYDIEMDTDYSIKVNSFSEGMQILKTQKILTSYRDNQKNFIFELALKILHESKACRLYLQSKYFKIYIDEYQDCDRDMHSLFMYLCDELKIDTFIVGDDKQSIYMWRGAYPEAFRSIKDKTNFSSIFMAENFRSCQQIQNYSNLLCEETRDLYKTVDNLENIILINTNISQWCLDILPYIDTSKKCALLRFRNDDAKNGAQIMTSNGIEMVNIPTIPIAEITTEVSWLYNAIAKFFILEKYSEYDLITEIPNGESPNLSKIKKFLNDIVQNRNNYDPFKEKVKNIAEFFGYTLEDRHLKKLYETVTEEIYHTAFKIEEYNNISITFHSSKGLEYDQVIVFANDYALNDLSSIYNHYVAVTRAKSRLIIVNCNNSRFINNLNNLLLPKHLQIQDIMSIV